MGLHYRSHNRLISRLSGRLPLFDEICKRTLSFMHGCTNSSNKIVKHVSIYSISFGQAQSVLGMNGLYSCDRFSINLHDLLRAGQFQNCLDGINYFCFQDYNLRSVEFNLLLELCYGINISCLTLYIMIILSIDQVNELIVHTCTA